MIPLEYLLALITRSSYVLGLAAFVACLGAGRFGRGHMTIHPTRLDVLK